MACGDFEKEPEWQDINMLVTMLSCKTFYNILKTEPRAWTNLYITSKTSPTLLAKHVENSAQLDLHIHFALKRAIAPRPDTFTYTWRTQSAIAAEAEGLFEAMSPYIDNALLRCSRLTVDAQTVSTSELMVRFLARAFTPRLKDVALKLTGSTITRAYRASTSGGDGPAFTVGNPAIKRLSLEGTIMFWRGGNRFTEMAELRLVDIDFSFSLTWQELLDMLEQMKSVTKLAVKRVNCMNIKDNSKKAELPNVTHFELAVNDPSAARLAGQILLPKLDAIRIETGGGMNARATATYCATALASVRTADIRLGEWEQDAFDSLFSALTGVTRVDMRRSGFVFTQRLLATMKAAKPMCPELEEVCVGVEWSADDIREALFGRAKGCFAEGCAFIVPSHHGSIYPWHRYTAVERNKVLSEPLSSRPEYYD
ncbi:hypothetical protein C8R46DRAFT_1221237 [Mycena filopes]|nr:hypothetical protein C8R46DRAFT_1221237 [Mycena filopes]